MRTWVVVLVLVLARVAHADDVRLHAEVDPQPFILGGYGGQIGARVGHVRGAVASFSLDVPDVIAQLGGNDGFHQHLRPSGALYGLYYLSDRSGWAFGGSLRLLRWEYTYDGDPGHADTWELSPEAIAAYQWHPTASGFYVQPWATVATTVYRHGDPRIDGHRYDPLPIQLFATVNLGWDLTL